MVDGLHLRSRVARHGQENRVCASGQHQIAVVQAVRLTCGILKAERARCRIQAAHLGMWQQLDL